MNLIIRELTVDDELAFLEGLLDWKNEELSWYSFLWKPGMDHEKHLALLKEQQSVAPANFVTSTMLYAFVEGKIVGRVSIRHELNEFLLQRGGHIGYAVNPSQRRKGYATEILKQALYFCKNRNISRVLLTCSDTNVASWKTIERNGGELEKKTFDQLKDEWLRRYWINLF